MTAVATAAPASPEPRRTRRAPRPVSNDMGRRLDDLRRCGFFRDGDLGMPTLPADSLEVARRHDSRIGGLN